MPESPNQPYDMLDLIHAVVDDGVVSRGASLLCEEPGGGFARLAGRSVGIVANQPAYLAGTLDIDASVKARGSCASATPSTSRW